MEEDPADVQLLDRRQLHLREPQGARREVRSRQRAELAQRVQPGGDHGRGPQAEEARDRGADETAVGQVADEGVHVGHDRPDRQVAPDLELTQRRLGAPIEHRHHRGHAHGPRHLAGDVDLLRLAVARDVAEPLVPAPVVLALGRAQVEGQLHHGTSTGCPLAAEA